MGIVMRTYVFICLFGIISMICIVLMSFSYKNPHKIQVSDRTLWQDHWKPYSLLKNHRDISEGLEDIKDVHLPAKLKDETNVLEDEDDMFSVKLFSDSDRRTNRNTASVKDSLDFASKDSLFDNDSKWSLLEESKTGPPQENDTSLSKEAEQVADKMFSTQWGRSSKEVKNKTEDNELHVLVREGMAALLGKKTSGDVSTEQQMLQKGKAEAEDRPLNVYAMAQAKIKMREELILRKRSMETSKYSLHFTKKKKVPTATLR